ncbi:MAG: hypothetical protein R3C52_09895, partial [Hyphomonadaceae bacterium]
MYLKSVLARSVALAAAVTALGGTAYAQTGPNESAPDDEGAREKVTVTATRTAEATDEVPATVSVITAEEIEAELAT